MEAVAEGDFGAAVVRLRASEPLDAAAAKRLEGMIAELARLKQNYAEVRLVLPLYECQHSQNYMMCQQPSRGPAQLAMGCR